MIRLDIFSYHVFVNYTCQYNLRGDMWFIKLTELIILDFNAYYFFVLC